MGVGGGGWVKDDALNVTHHLSTNLLAYRVETCINNIIGTFLNGLIKVI